MKIVKYLFMARDKNGREEKFGEFRLGLVDELIPFCVIKEEKKLGL